MKKRTAKSIATDLLKARTKVMNAHKAMTDAQRYFDNAVASHAELPARLQEAWNDLTEAEDRSTEANAVLTKPLDAYAFEGNYRYGRQNAPRKYSSQVAQTAWDAERRAERAREYYEHLKSEAVRTLDDYTADDRERLEYATAEFKSACDLRDNLVALFTNTTGHEPTFEECEALTAKKVKDTPEMIEVYARITETGYVVIAEKLAAALRDVKEISINGITYFASHIREWSKVETGQLTVTIDANTIIVKSPDSRASFKAIKHQKPAPALQFVSIS